jgi:hypothetical protein
VDNYRQRYEGRAFLPPAYEKRLAQLIALLRQKYKVHEDRRPQPAHATKWAVRAFDEQLTLF